MTSLLRPGAGILFMKVGTHAREDLTQIIARKSQEIERNGFAMWGYGGNTCHPGTMVQPFARSFAQQGEPIYLCMEEMDSKHWAEPQCAAEFSVDGVQWQAVPESIDVKGSRYALVIDQLEAQAFKLPLDKTRVPIGPSTGRLGSRYIRGQVDKACLEILDQSELVNEEEVREVSIHLTAVLRQPYAVFLRNYR